MHKKYLVLFVSAGFLMAVNGQAQWVQQTSNTTNWLRAIHCTDANTCYSSGVGTGFLIKTTNGGAVWAPVASFPANSGSVFSLFFTNANEGYVTSTGGYIWYTPDAGNTWNQLYFSNTTNILYSIHLPDNSTAYAVGSNGTIMKSTTPSNQFGSWTVQNSGTTKALRGVHFVNPNTGFAVGDAGAILKTINGGTNWTDISFNTINPLYAVKFLNQNIGYAVGGEYAAVGGSPMILKTIDGGANWVSLTLPRNPPVTGNYEYNLYSVCLDADIVYAVGYVGIILKSTNGGNTWTVQNSTTTSQLWSVHCVNKDIVYAAGLDGRIVKTTNGGGPPETSATAATAMTARKGITLDTVVLNFEEITAAGVTGYNVYEGNMPFVAAMPYTHRLAPGNVCNVATTLATGRRTTPAAGIGSAGSHYYLVTAFNATLEGTAGFNSAAVEIPPAMSTCAP